MARKPLKDDAAMYAELKASTDRGLGILAATYLEECLLDGILDRMHITTPKVVDELTGNGAPLGTFSNKIMMAEALKVIGPETRQDCDRIRRIRNECAHQVNPVSFSNQMLHDLSKALKPRLWGGIAYDKPHLPDDPRERYFEACDKIAGAILWLLPRDLDDTDVHPVLW